MSRILLGYATITMAAKLLSIDTITVWEMAFVLYSVHDSAKSRSHS